MARKYHTIITQEDDGVWSPQFGDYDLEVVRQERLDMLDSVSMDYKAKRVKILTTPDAKQKTINDYVKRYNEGKP